MSYDPTTIAVLRRALDEVLLDPRFYRSPSASALEIAEHILSQAAAGERDLERLKSSAFGKLAGAPTQDQAA
jgi:broad specificity phosphatase PhoE